MKKRKARTERLRIELPRGISRRKLREILEKHGFRQINDGSVRRTMYINVYIGRNIYIPIPINFHCFCREENNKVFLSCHVDYRDRVKDETREIWLIAQNGRVNRYFIEKLAKKITKIIEDVIKVNWKKIKREIENEIKCEIWFKK